MDAFIILITLGDAGIDDSHLLLGDFDLDFVFDRGTTAL
jgi:hypothetical protein